ncbi:YciI family protein [Ornithinimicrobium faecis]|uniref:YciI family protein n=1 Tax=Ornithinimicrobium faecis TaxID=2934158 RepID=A0ABY4YY26_9MICO|nr:YciI family protein [Ornithinimicrobium sp. HY1793]USQ81512.1 YciI family protein [Ornithinimicrobium sp. HY1793]
MRYALLLHSREPGQGEIDPDAITAMQEAFGAYGRALESAGVLVAAEVLEQQHASSTVTVREGALQVQDGPFAETKEALAGVIVIDVPDLDAALAWAEKCPGATYGAVEVRPAATSYINGAWT